MSVKDRETKFLFRIITYLTLIGFAFNFISFVSPFWITTKPSENRLFLRIGLWTVCFNGYIRPYKYDKAYFGCYYIYFKEYDAIRDWLNPAWLYAVQVMSSLGIAAHSISIFIVLTQTLLVFSHQNITTIATIIFTNFFTGLCLLLALIAFGVESSDSRWIQFPQYNTLSWAYGFAAIAFIITVAVFCLLIHLFMKVSSIKEKIEQRRLHERQEKNGIYHVSEELHTAPYDPRAPPGMYQDNDDD